MISRHHRFHGFNSLRHVYRQGKVSRGALFAVKAVPNSQRQTYRAAVVVSRKVNKSAVVRNRIRRQMFEIINQLSPQFVRPYDIVITIFHDTVSDTKPAELTGQLNKQLKELDILPRYTGPKPAS